MLSANQTLHKGRYRVIDHFTTNSENVLYEAYDTVSDSKVVIKECVGSPSKVFTTSRREASDNAFFGAAQALTEMKHDSLVSVQDYFSDIGRQYLVLEVVEGFDLNKYLDPAVERPDLSVALEWADQLLNALHFLHTLAPPVIHADIRPENIRFSASGEIKLLMANLAALPTGTGNEADLNAAAAGGSINYQSLEQLWPSLDRTSQHSLLKDYDERSERILLSPLDAQSDVYSIGACLYHVLTGEMPIDALDRSIALREHKPDPLKKPYEIVKNIPVEISDSVMKALEIRREQRFYSAIVMAQVLRTAVVKAAERNNTEPIAERDDPLDLLGDLPATGGLQITSAGADARQRELVAEQLKLEEEQKRIEERRQAIEAERTRLEHEAEMERQRVEQERRIEETKRLEAQAEYERVLAAKKLAQIEAEKQKRLAEAENLEREAEEERKRAEEKIAFLQAEKERRLSEEQKAAAAAREELVRAEQLLLELSHADPPIAVSAAANAEEEDLLELDAVHSSNPTVPKPLEVLLDKPVENIVPSKQFDVREYGFKDFSSPSAFNWKPIAIGAAAVIVVVFVLGWLLLGSGDTTADPEMQVQSSFAVPAPDTQTTTENFAADEQPAGVPEQTLSSEMPVADPASQTMVDSPQKIEGAAVRTTDRVKAAEKPKKLAATANKPTPKKVTVDDLINDN